MIRDFTYESRPSRVVFAAGAVGLLQREVTRLAIRRLIVVCTPPQAGLAQAVTAPLGETVAAIHPHA